LSVGKQGNSPGTNKYDIDKAIQEDGAIASTLSRIFLILGKFRNDVRFVRYMVVGDASLKTINNRKSINTHKKACLCKEIYNEK